MDQYEADDIITTDPSGRVTDKVRERMDLRSGDFKIESEELSEIKVDLVRQTRATGAVLDKLVGLADQTSNRSA